MVEDRITDGKRIAQLLASELTGRSNPPLDRVDVVHADPDADPTDEGSYAYAVTIDGERIGEVFVHERGARVELTVGSDADTAALAEHAPGLESDRTADGVRIRVASGAAVKGAVDALVAVVRDA